MLNHSGEPVQVDILSDGSYRVECICEGVELIRRASEAFFDVVFRLDDDSTVGAKPPPNFRRLLKELGIGREHSPVLFFVQPITDSPKEIRSEVGEPVFSCYVCQFPFSPFRSLGELAEMK